MTQISEVTDWLKTHIRMSPSEEILVKLCYIVLGCVCVCVCVRVRACV